MIAVEFTHEIDLDNHILEVEVTAMVTIYREDDYDCDYDGNRGRSIVSVQLQNISIQDSRGHDLTDRIINKYYSEYEYIVDKALESAEEIS